MSEIPEDVMTAATQALFGRVPDDFMATISTRDNVLVHRCARAILAERERIASELFNRPAFMTAVAGDGKPYVKIEFETMKEMQEFHGALVDLSKHKATA